MERAWGGNQRLKALSSNGRYLMNQCGTDREQIVVSKEVWLRAKAPRYGSIEAGRDSGAWRAGNNRRQGKPGKTNTAILCGPIVTMTEVLHRRRWSLN
jgi:hypothetical protein